MKQWDVFTEYVESKKMTASSAYKAAMRHVFFMASDHYKHAFMEQQDTSNNFIFLLNLGDCFLRLEEYQFAIDTLEFAKNSYKSNARLLAILGEAYFHIDDIPKSLLYFREAFYVDPSEVDLDLIKAKPVRDLVEIIKRGRSDYKNINEWIPVYGFLHDIFYVKRNINTHQADVIQNDLYNLEVNYQKMSRDQLENSNVVPRLINKYLWMLDYYELQNYSFENISQIRERLMNISSDLFKEYFEKKKL